MPTYPSQRIAATALEERIRPGWVTRVIEYLALATRTVRT